jgi:hypothetical protein
MPSCVGLDVSFFGHARSFRWCSWSTGEGCTGTACNPPSKQRRPRREFRRCHDCPLPGNVCQPEFLRHGIRRVPSHRRTILSASGMARWPARRHDRSQSQVPHRHAPSSRHGNAPAGLPDAVPVAARVASGSRDKRQVRALAPTSNGRTARQPFHTEHVARATFQQKPGMHRVTNSNVTTWSRDRVERSTWSRPPTLSSV